MTTIQTLIDAAATGAVYALMAVGIGLVFGVLRLVNFAYGQLVMAGAYALALTNGLNPVLLSERVGNYQDHPLWGTLFDQLWVK